MRQTPSKSLRGIAAALCLGSLAVAGQAAAQVSDDVVKIGVLTDMSGQYSDLNGPGSLLAAQMAAADFGGKVLGKPIEIIGADHQQKADIGVGIARRWIENEKVDAISDVTNSAIALAVQQLTRETNRVALFSSPGTTDLTGKQCSPTGFQWVYDNYSNAVGPMKALIDKGNDTFFIITADFAFGHSLEKIASAAIAANGGKVLGTVRHPFGANDLSAFLLPAQASKAKVIVLATAGKDMTTAIKQANEFGIIAGGQAVSAPVVFITDVHALGLSTAQGISFIEGFYWDQNDETRAFAKRFFEARKAMPTAPQAGVYSSIRHYLKAIQAAGTDEAKAVAAKMREMPVDDFFAKGGKVREDGRMVHDMLLVQVKKPSESKQPWDYYNVVATVPGEQAFQSLAQSECPLVKK
ncbi:ABC-type branched-chain amino acid transport system, periplasmic component [Bradyrhizobium sp. YR681]|uniref:ABC transporter substrate-binding protein n=1 Tax=Bradyrhizobium sp. YR681 TaxID=1144344 RepID=UPI000270D772|nr:ABC transporter substrate-binding protein [Bradyrhizobium sp. YR681]EJN13904.1 ABC-type branched-chain amino acid transport system, periplasmic component [Bradyrhizobium sp. YR681]